MSEEEQKNSSQEINIFNIIEEEEEEHSGKSEKDSSSISTAKKTEEEESSEVSKDISEIFRLNVNEAMAKKSLTPSITVMISIEADPNQEDAFWNNKLVLNVLSSNFIIVRLSQTKNIIEIFQFSSIFVIKAVPSLYVFGPFSQGVSYAWPDQYPTPSEFVQYVRNNLLNKSPAQTSSTDFSDLIIQPHIQSPSPTPNTDQTLHYHYSTPNTNQQQAAMSPQLSNNQSYLHQTSSSSSLLHQPVPINQSNRNLNDNDNDMNLFNSQDNVNNDINLLGSTSSNNSNTIKKSSTSALRKSTARISVQLKGQHTNFEFSRETPVGDVVNAIESKFGRSYELYVPHLRRCIGFTSEELQKSIASADLAPSATIILRGPDDPGFSSNIRNNNDYDNDYLNGQNQNNNENLNLEPYRPPPSNSDKQFTSNAGNDARPSLGIEEGLPRLGHTDTPEVVPSSEIANNDEDPENGRRATENGCGWSLVKKILSILNPFGDIEEVEDFFETKEFRT